MDDILKLEKQISSLKQKRDDLIKRSGASKAELEKILSFRTPTKTLCQLLRELHDVLDGEQREKIETCLLIAKKMNKRLVEYAGNQYSKEWYDKNGNFIEDK